VDHEIRQGHSRGEGEASKSTSDVAMQESEVQCYVPPSFILDVNMQVHHVRVFGCCAQLRVITVYKMNSQVLPLQ
jgi:hypothetical protein